MAVPDTTGAYGRWWNRNLQNLPVDNQREPESESAHDRRDDFVVALFIDPIPLL